MMILGLGRDGEIADVAYWHLADDLNVRDHMAIPARAQRPQLSDYASDTQALSQSDRGPALNRTALTSPSGSLHTANVTTCCRATLPARHRQIFTSTRSVQGWG
jgi:hypothetical protein